MARFYFLFLLIAAFPATGSLKASVSPACYTPMATAFYPKLRTTWGKLPGGKVVVSNMAAFIDSSFHVVDDKGAVYTITRFRITYKRKAQYKDEDTGQTHNTTLLLSREFFDTPKLEELWVNNIRDGLQAGEEFTVDTIVVTDAAGHKYMAPDLFFQLV